MKATLLGTSSARPIPRPGCACPQCSEARADARFARTRSGLLLETDTSATLIDCGPDIAQQLERRARAGLPVRVDRVVITHRHPDHVLGLDDLVHLRTNRDGVLPVHLGDDHREKLGVQWRHLMRPSAPLIELLPWAPGDVLDLGGLTLEGFETGHRARFGTTGALITVRAHGTGRRIAYATDMGDGEPSPAARLAGVDLFVGDGTFLGEPGYGHPGTDRVVGMAKALGACYVAFTHVGHWRLAHAQAARMLGPDVAICRDGDDLLRMADALAGA